jgi:hypothetical protein
MTPAMRYVAGTRANGKRHRTPVLRGRYDSDADEGKDETMTPVSSIGVIPHSQDGPWSLRPVVFMAVRR